MVINKEHVEAALDDIDKSRVPPRRTSRTHCLKARSRHYPPKYVVAVAHGKQTGRELNPSQHGRKAGR